jgi:hypothetical protein
MMRWVESRVKGSHCQIRAGSVQFQLWTNLCFIPKNAHGLVVIPRASFETTSSDAARILHVLNPMPMEHLYQFGSVVKEFDNLCKTNKSSTPTWATWRHGYGIADATGQRSRNSGMGIYLSIRFGQLTTWSDPVVDKLCPTRSWHILLGSLSSWKTALPCSRVDSALY